MSRLQRILAAVLIVQIAVAGVVYWPRSSGSASSEALIGELEAEKIVKFTITDGSSSPITLSRELGQWVLASASDYPVDSEKIQPILEKLTAIQTGRLVTRTSASHKRLEVSEDDYQRRVQFELDDGSRYTIFIGSSAGTQATHVRLGGQDEVYLTDELTSWEFGTSTSNWIDTSYLTISSDTIQTMVLENRNGIFEFEKDGEGLWLMPGLAEDEEFNLDHLNSLINRVSSLRMTEPLGIEEKPAYGLDAPLAKVTLTTLDEAGGGDTYTLRVGRSIEGASATTIVHASTSAYIVSVNSFSVEDLIDSTRSDFIKPPPTPEVEGTPES